MTNTTKSQKPTPDFFLLNRPQYVASPEALLSSLAWLGAEPSPEIDDLPGAIVYRSRTKTGKAGQLETSPTARDAAERLQHLERHLRENTSLDADDAKVAAKIVASQLESQTREKAKSVGILPLDLTAALMQNASGVLGVANPPNYGAILEQMFALGADVDGSSASGLLIDLFAAGDESDAAMTWMGGCLRAMAPAQIVAISQGLVAPGTMGHGRPVWLEGAHTPYRWFNEAWTSLCTGKWLESMPRRRWVDWATCVLRTAIGAGFLYEMNFYFRLVSTLTDDEDPRETARSLVRPDTGILRWEPGQSTSKQDIAQAIQRLSHVGTACRSFVVAAGGRGELPKLADYVTMQDGLEAWIRASRSFMTEELQQLRRDALGVGKLPAGKNVYETINGSLVARSGGIGWVDSYSMLRKRGNRYTVVDPGQDWLGVVASLGAKNAGGQSRVATLLASLASIGLRPSYNTVVEYLESAGLARSSHDADDAVEIAAAF